MKKILIAFVILSSVEGLPIIANAQLTESGIRWTTGLSWKQVKEKAKAENKYIFLDVMATWCGPCKMMDKQVFVNDSVGDYFNQHFISVKVQSDKTAKDNDYIKSWYNDATAIDKEYRVQAFPTFIFLSPQGEIVDMQSGASSNIALFIGYGKEAIKPGKKYNDPWASYDSLVAAYKNGIINYDKLPFMIEKASRIDSTLRSELMKIHIEYVSSLPATERYTWENINFWSSLILTSGRPLFQFFYKDGDLIDKVMKVDGYSAKIVDKTIQREVVDSFFRMQKGETTTITGQKVKNSEIMFMRLPVRMDGKVVPDYAEADWKRLTKMVSKKFGKSYAERNVLAAKIRWYDQHQNIVGSLNTYAILLNKDLNNSRDIAGEINQRAFPIFLNSNDRNVLTNCAECMKKVVEIRPCMETFDTYANLLYKLGKKQEAIEWQEKAVKLGPGEEEVVTALQKMKEGGSPYGIAPLK